MQPQKFRKKPVVIEAMCTDDYDEALEAMAWCGGIAVDWENADKGTPDDALFYISTLEGFLFVTKGDWIIKGVKGEFYPCKPDIFMATYEDVPQSEGLTDGT